MTLREIIIQKIGRNETISFHDFMEMALYYPLLGYYTSDSDTIEMNRDYYTSPMLTAAFGATVGMQLMEMWKILGEDHFTIVEYGAGTGTLCRDILNYAKNYPDFYDQLTYCIIEKRPAMGQTETIDSSGKVTRYSTIEEIADINGCVLSNELVDNFPVHQVVMADELLEVCVGYKDGFVEVLKPASQELKDYLAELNVSLPREFRTEINLDAVKWIAEVASCLKNGFVLTIDYGNDSSRMYSKHHSAGTLLCYKNHNVNISPYESIGQQDITSHVNFSALCHWGEKNGLGLCGYTNQADFLISLGINHHLMEMIRPAPDNYINYKKEAFVKYKLLVDMGDKFKVLIQQKGNPAKNLSGLRLSNISKPYSSV